MEENRLNTEVKPLRSAVRQGRHLPLTLKKTFEGLQLLAVTRWHSPASHLHQSQSDRFWQPE